LRMLMICSSLNLVLRIKEFSSVGYITGELSLFLHLFSGRRSMSQLAVHEQ
jgi:hypothetical protein